MRITRLEVTEEKREREEATTEMRGRERERRGNGNGNASSLGREEERSGGGIGLTSEQEDLWDTRSLYSSQLTMEDLLWTDWFGGSDEVAGLEEAIAAKPQEAMATLTREEEGRVALEGRGLSSNEMAKRVLYKTNQGKPRHCVGTNLFKVGSIAVSLWCDLESTSRDMTEAFGRGKCNPTLLFTDKCTQVKVEGVEGFTPKDYVLKHPSEMGLAICATTTKPVAYREWKKIAMGVLGDKNSEKVREALEKLESSDVLYEGFLGIPLPRILFHEPKHGTVDLEHSSEWKLPAIRKIQEASVAASRGLRKHLLRCQKEYVKVGAEFVFDFKKSESGMKGGQPDYDSFGLDSFGSFNSIHETASPFPLSSPNEDMVDLMVVAPPDRYGKRSSIRLGTFGMTDLGYKLLNTSVFEARDESLVTSKNYPLLGLSYVANGFTGVQWQQKLPRWRRVLRTSGRKLKQKLSFLIRTKGKREFPNKGIDDAAESSLDALEVAHGECMAGMYYMKTNFESYDLRAGNPIPMLLHSLHTRSLRTKGLYQLQ